MSHSGRAYISQKTASQAISDSGKAQTSPRAKLPLPRATDTSPPTLSDNAFIPIALSQRVSPVILSNRIGRKGGACPRGAQRGAGGRLAKRLASALDELPVIAGMALDAVRVKRDLGPRAIRIKPLAGQVRAKPRILVPLAGLVVLLVSRPALAQTDDKVVTPIELFEPERGEGIRIGSGLLAFPALDAEVTYDSNVYNTPILETNDLVASLRPRLTLRTDLARHAFSLTGGAEVRRHAEMTAEDSEQFEIHGKAVLDLAARTEVVADAGFRRGIEQRGTSGDQFMTDRPVSYNRKYAGLLVRRQGGFLELLGEGRISSTDYNDTTLNGLPVDLSSRDATVKRARIRGSAPSSHYSRVFVEASINSVSYESATPVSRDSHGYAVLAGMLLRLTDLVNLEVGAGYIHQTFDNPAVASVGAVNFHLQADWTPRPDWQIVAAANRTVEPSPRLDVPAIVRSEFSLEARKSLGNRALVSAEVGVVDEQYRGSGREDRRFYAAAGVHYRLTDQIGLVARASWRNQDGNALGRDYEGVAATIGVRMRF